MTRYNFQYTTENKLFNDKNSVTHLRFDKGDDLNKS